MNHTDNKALADRLRKMADECKDADDSENTHGTLIPRVSGFVYDDLMEAARLLTSPQADKARGEVFGYVRSDGFIRAIHWTGGEPPADWTPVYTTPQPQGDASPEGNPCVECGADPGQKCFPNCAIHASPEVSGGGERSSVYAALRSIRYNAENGSQDRPHHVRLRLIANEANKAIATMESALSTPQARPDGDCTCHYLPPRDCPHKPHNSESAPAPDGGKAVLGEGSIEALLDGYELAVLRQDATSDADRDEFCRLILRATHPAPDVARQAALDEMLKIATKDYDEAGEVFDPWTAENRETIDNWYQALRAEHTLAAPQPQGDASPNADRMAIRMLVAAGFVTEAKANEALNIAHGFDKGPLTLQARPDGGEAVPFAWLGCKSLGGGHFEWTTIFAPPDTADEAAFDYWTAVYTAPAPDVARVPGFMDIDSDRVLIVDHHDWPCTPGFKNVWITAAQQEGGQ